MKKRDGSGRVDASKTTAAEFRAAEGGATPDDRVFFGPTGLGPLPYPGTEGVTDLDV
ncbi:MAG: hypothetical protein V1798_09915 [Pseudomonadota bacterium]